MLIYDRSAWARPQSSVAVLLSCSGILCHCAQKMLIHYPLAIFPENALSKFRGGPRQLNATVEIESSHCDVVNEFSAITLRTDYADN